jgi:glycyl-tRNA synthetase beta chain
VQNFDAVKARKPARPLDFDQRMHAVQAFRELPEADSLAAANKRIRNILRKAQEADISVPAEYDAGLLLEPAEQDLARALADLEARVQPLFLIREYTRALQQLAALQVPVDTFFDKVMVMSDDNALRNNRLALLNAVSELFLQVADISLLQ